MTTIRDWTILEVVHATTKMLEMVHQRAVTMMNERSCMKWDKKIEFGNDFFSDKILSSNNVENYECRAGSYTKQKSNAVDKYIVCDNEHLVTL